MDPDDAAQAQQILQAGGDQPDDGEDPQHEDCRQNRRASGTNACSESTENPRASSELDRAITYSVALAPLSVTVELAAIWSTKCSVVTALMTACSRPC